MKKQFYKNVLPSMLAFAFSGVYAIVDAFFIGQKVGDIGLAAVNIAFPISALLLAIGTGIGMGGAVQVAVSLGQGDTEKQKKYLGNALSMLAISCVLFTVLLSVFYTPILRLFGAEGELLRYAQEYIKYIALGATCQVLSTGLVPIVRNYNGAFVAMAAMIAGFATNVVFDWLFVFVLDYGIAGAAVATLIGEAVSIIPCIIFLIVKKKLIGFAKYKLVAENVKRVILSGVSPLGLTFSPNIVIIIMNMTALKYGGNDAVSCYAVISYTVCVVVLLLQGVGDGCQPLLSLYFGRGEREKVLQVRTLAYLTSLVVSIIAGVGMFLLRYDIPKLFGSSAEIAKMSADAMPIFIIGFIFIGFLRVTTSYFYATEADGYACIPVYGEPIMLTVLILFLFPHVWGLTGVWAAVPVTQILLSIVCVFLLKNQAKNQIK